MSETQDTTLNWASVLFLLFGENMLTPQKLFEAIKQTINDVMSIDRRITDVDSWDGSASRWPDTESYCNSCLINLNEGPAEDWTQGKCKLPVRNPGDSKDTYVRQAVHAAAARFNQVDAPQDALNSARNELLKAYREMDEEPPEVLSRAISSQRLQQALFNRMFELDEAIEGSDHYLVDTYYDENGMYALYVDRGKLYRYPLMVQEDNIMYGPRQQVMEVHQPVQMRTVIRQQEDGRYRWFSVSGTAVLNRSGEIDSRELFDSFITHAEQTGEYPYRTFYHKGEVFRTGQADYLARDDYCYLTSGLFDDTPLAQASIEAHRNNPNYWGESIGFLPTQKAELTEISNGIKIPVYRQGINIEISDVPQNEAAHLFTRTEVQRMALDGKAWEAFLKLWGDDEEKARQWLEDNPEARNRAIQEAGMITRDGAEGADNVDGDEKPPIVIDDTVIEAVTRSEVFTNLQQSVTELQNTVTGLSDGQTKLAEALTKLTETQDKITERLAKLDKVEATQQRQVTDDTPAKFTNGQQRVIYRPREAHSNNGESATFAEIAQSRIPKGAY